MHVAFVLTAAGLAYAVHKAEERFEISNKLSEWWAPLTKSDEPFDGMRAVLLVVLILVGVTALKHLC